MITIYDEILSNFYNTSQGIVKLNDFYIYKDSKSYGVGVINENSVLIDESLANVEIKNINFPTTQGETLNFIILTSTLKTHKNEFASFCAQFVELGKNKINRNLILEKPLNWWNSWKELIGNKIVKIAPYDIIAELLTLEKISNNHTNVKWSGPTGTTIDIETMTSTFEVKSSIVRYENEVTISSHLQIQQSTETRKNFLVFMKVEQLEGGHTINSIMSRLKKIEGLEIGSIEEQLHQKGFRLNSSSRNTPYVVHETRIYDINENFPKITLESFKDNKLPNNIKKISYVVSLEGIEYTKMDW